MEPITSPEGHARKVGAGTDIVMQIHYHPSGKPERDRSRVGLYFYRRPVEGVVGQIVLINRRFVIPAGAHDEAVKASFTLSHPVTLTAITPHMHYLGRTMEVTARFPSGAQRQLIRIGDWDWNWQLQYRLKRPIELPAGTRLDLVAHYDNSADNPANPHQPPQPVRWGDQTSDEMCLCFLEVILPDDAALRRLRRDQLAVAVRRDPTVLLRFIPPLTERHPRPSSRDPFDSPNDSTSKR